MVADVVTVALILCGLTLAIFLLRDLRANRSRLDVIAQRVDTLTAEVAEQRQAQERDEALARSYLIQQVPRKGRHLRGVPGVASLALLTDTWQEHRQRVVLASVITAGLFAIPGGVAPPDTPAPGAPAPYSAPQPTREAPAPTTDPASPAPRQSATQEPATEPRPARGTQPARPPQATPSPIPESSRTEPPPDWCLRLVPPTMRIDHCVNWVTRNGPPG